MKSYLKFPYLGKTLLVAKNLTFTMRGEKNGSSDSVGFCGFISLGKSGDHHLGWC